MKKNDSLHVEISIFKVVRISDHKKGSTSISQNKAPKLKQQQTRESLRGARDSNNDFREINSSRIMLDARS